MSPGTLFTTIIVVLFLYAIWDTWSKLGKIYVAYEGKDKTVQFKWLKKDKDDCVVIDNKKFTILPEAVQSAWDFKGIHILFPTKVNYLHLVWNSKYPTIADSNAPSWDSPAFRNMFNLETVVKSFFRNYVPTDQSKKKAQTGVSQWIPYIIIFAVIIVVVLYMTSQVNSVKDVVNSIVQQIGEIKVRLPK